jgi:hypothetical protein
MITPAYSPTATERILPRMALDFTTGVLDSRVTITRALNTATRTNSSGVLEIVNANLPRFNYNPTTLAAIGLLIEEQRTNLFLNSLIDGTPLLTQTVAVTAVSHTISFYGTGTITLSGASTATVVGTGVYPNRRTLTFTPTAGLLVCTVTGSVQYAQIEVGAFATSFIPSAATSATRNSDVVVMTGTNFSSWYNASEGTFVVKAANVLATSGTNPRLTQADDGTENNRVATIATSSVGRAIITTGAALCYDDSVAYTGSTLTVAARYKASNYRVATNTVLGVVGGSANATPAVTLLRIGASVTAVQGSRNIQKILFFPQALTNSELQAFSK